MLNKLLSLSWREWTQHFCSVHQLPLLLCYYHFCCALLAVADADTHFQNGILKVPSGSCVWKQKAPTNIFHPLKASVGIRQDSSLALLAGDQARERSSSPARGWRQPGPPVLFHTECHFSNSWPFTTYWEEKKLKEVFMWFPYSTNQLLCTQHIA